MAAKRKRSTVAAVASAAAAVDAAVDIPKLNGSPLPSANGTQASKRKAAVRGAGKASTNPNKNADIIDAPDALRASPDSDVNEDIAPGPIKMDEGPESPLSDVPDMEPPTKKQATKVNGTATTMPKTPPKSKATSKAENETPGDPEAEGEEEAGEEEVQEALSRPPPVHSSYLPLPWKGRLGYACLNTYLRYSNPPVFCSRTCRIASILEHRHPLKDPSQPEHATKNRPDRSQPADEARGMKYVQDICLANVRDIAKMIRWNDRYGIKFLRLSSEMFPFASHEEYGYKLAPFASDALAEAGKVIAELGHRVTTHPGQFTQLGSPRKSVIDNAIRDLAYHDEMLSLLKLPEQQDKDAVMILHLGGVFGDKAATLDRFRENYAKLPQSVKNRMVLENDDVSWSVHDLLPVCEELNIPMVLDYHHHNIIFDPDQIREGTADIMNLYPRIRATWERKGITQKMHYSEPTPAAITGRQRRKHNPRVASLPPCADDMDLMIEAKDKEQAVFELMRTFKLPGFETFNDILPHIRNDDNKVALANTNKKPKKTTPKKTSKKIKVEEDASVEDEEITPEAPAPTVLIPDEDVGMGGPEGRVYWPPGMEDWLRPKKREIKKKPDPSAAKLLTPAQKKKLAAESAAQDAAALQAVVKIEDEGPSESDEGATPATKKAKKALRDKAKAQMAKAAALASDAKTMVKKEENDDDDTQTDAITTATAPSVPVRTINGKAKTTKATKAAPKRAKKEAKAVPTPTPSSSDAEDDLSEELPSDSGDDEDIKPAAVPGSRKATAAAVGARKSNRATKKAKVSYEEEDGDVDMEE